MHDVVERAYYYYYSCVLCFADKKCTSYILHLTLSAVKILDNSLGLAGKEWMKPYEYMYMSDMNGRKVNLYNLTKIKLKSVHGGRSFGYANRSTLQHTLLDALKLKDDNGKNIKDDDDRLHCSTSVTGYQNMNGKNNADGESFVRVELSDGTIVDASALLVCDVIHSSVRKRMHQDAIDTLNYCGQECWWGKTTIEAGSDLDKELQRIVKFEGDKLENRNMSLFVIGTSKRPGAFFSCEVAENEHAWGYVVATKTPPAANASKDLTRRGGSVLTAEEKKREIDEAVAGRNELVGLIMRQAPDITKAGFFDRINLSLSYVDGRVALLGDAAHPQSPMMGQGANMAIVDGYVVATRISAAIKIDSNISSGSVEQALLDFDSKVRRKDNNCVIMKARRYGKFSISNNRFYCWATKVMCKFMPSSLIISDMVSGDKSNKQFVHAMEKDLQLEV